MANTNNAHIMKGICVLSFLLFSLVVCSCTGKCDCEEVIACSCEPNAGCECNNNPEEEGEYPYFKIDRSMAFVKSYSTALTISVYSNLRWCLSSNSELIPVTEDYFQGNGEVKFNIPANDTGKMRYFVITFTYFPDGTTINRERQILTLAQEG